MSSKESKMDMSLDQIINLDKKRGGGQFSTPRGRGRGQTRGRGRGAAGRGRGRGGGGSSTVRVGLSVGLRGRRMGKVASLATTSSFASNRAGRQRVAQNLVKRAMLQRRRQAIGQRGEANSARFAGQTEKSQRLLQEVRRWRQTAQVLQTALHNQQQRGSPKKVQLLRRTGGRFINAGQNRPSIQNRLGWRGRGIVRRGGGRGSILTPSSPIRPQVLPQNRVTLSRGTLAGQMQSDIIAREQIRQQRLTNEILSRALQNISTPRGGRVRRGFGGSRSRGRGRFNIEIAQNNVSRRFGGQVGGGSPRFQQVRTINTNFGNSRRNFRGRRGGGGFNSPLRSSNSDTLNMFRSASSSGTTLNERFGGSGGFSDGFAVGGQRGRRGRGRGGRGRNSQYNF